MISGKENYLDQLIKGLFKQNSDKQENQVRDVLKMSVTNNDQTSKLHKSKTRQVSKSLDALK